MTRAEWFTAATLLIATVGLLQTLGFWRAVYIGWSRRREYYPARLKASHKRRAREASLREAEQAAPGLFGFLRQKLTQDPHGRLLRVTWGAAVRIHHTEPDFEYADDSRAGDLGPRAEAPACTRRWTVPAGRCPSLHYSRRSRFDRQRA